MKIYLAFCKELNRVVDIQQACQEFANQTSVARFNFLCSDPICRGSRSGGVRISAVNHYKSPVEQVTFVTPHYRELDKHTNLCDWVELDAATEDLHSSPSETDAATNIQRKKLQKITRLITDFKLTNDSNELTDNGLVDGLNEIRIIKDRSLRRKKLLKLSSGRGSSTTSFEALVSCFEEIKDEGLLDEILHITGEGNFSWRNVFRQVTRGPGEAFTVYYGGARLVKRYGKGFALRFMDNFVDKAIDLYMPPGVINESKSSAYLNRILDDYEEPHNHQRPYLRVYWIGGFELGNKGWDVKPLSPVYLALRLVYPAAKP